MYFNIWVTLLEGTVIKIHFLFVSISKLLSNNITCTERTNMTSKWTKRDFKRGKRSKCFSEAQIVDDNYPVPSVKSSMGVKDTIIIKSI